MHASVPPTRPTAATRPATSSAIYTAPDGKTVDDPAFQKKVLDNLNQVEKDHPDQILRSIGYFKSPDSCSRTWPTTTRSTLHVDPAQGRQRRHDPEQLQQEHRRDGTTVKDALNIDGIDVQLAGLQPLASELTGTIGEDQKRAEVAAIPLVCVVLFFVFGGVVAASAARRSSAA